MNDPRATATLHAVPAAGDELDGRYAADAWQAADLGVPAARGAGAVSFTRIDPPWLREAVNRGPGNAWQPAAHSTLSAPELLPSNGSPNF